MKFLPKQVSLLVMIPHQTFEVMNRNRKIFIIVSIIFVAIFVGIAIDMASRTTAPWNKKKQLVRAFDVTSDADSIGIDTTSVNVK